MLQSQAGNDHMSVNEGTNAETARQSTMLTATSPFPPLTSIRLGIKGWQPFWDHLTSSV